jgi:protein kinase A
MAPEVMSKQNHGVAVDYYGLGVICYEIIMGVRPYSGKSRKDIKDTVMKLQTQIKKKDVPKGWSLVAIDFVNQLIQRKPLKRLGFNGPEEVKDHPFLKGTNWKELLDKKLKPPFIPKAKKPVSVRPLTTTEEDRAMKEKEEENILLRRHSVQKLFNGYHYDIELVYKDQIEKDTEERRLKDSMEKIIKNKIIMTTVSLEMNSKTEETLALIRPS